MNEFRSADRNPFRITNIESLDWLPYPSSLDEIYHNLHQLNFKGQIVGGHGFGKTTLAHLLSKKMSENGVMNKYLFANLENARSAINQWDLEIKHSPEGTVFIFDGIGHAPFFKRRKFLFKTSRYIAIVHEQLKKVPELCTLDVSPRLLEQLSIQLAGHEGRLSLQKAGGAQALLEKNEYNLRNCFFDLYKIWSRLDN